MRQISPNAPTWQPEVTVKGVARVASSFKKGGGGKKKKATRDLLMFVNITGRFPASTLLQYSKMQRALVSISCNENKRARRRRKDVIVTRLNL